MASVVEEMFSRLYGSEWVEDIQRTPLCKLRARLPEPDRAYGGLDSRDRPYVHTTYQINTMLDRALELKR